MKTPANYDGHSPERVTTTSMRNILVARGSLSPAEASVVLDRLAEAIDATYQQGKTPGAICPENVFISSDGKVRLGPSSNFATGAAVKPATTAIVGYYSPEEAWNEAATVATSVWALGALLYEMLTGQVPLPALHPASLAKPDVRWGARRLPDAVAYSQPVVDRALRRTPTDRYPSAQAMANALWEVLPQPAPDASHPRRTAATAAAATAVVVEAEPGAPKAGGMLGLQQAVNRPLRLSGTPETTQQRSPRWRLFG